MKKYIKGIVGCAMLLSAATFTSCSSDYLETKPTESAEEGDFLSKADNQYKALNGIAKAMTTQQYYFGQGFAGENGIWWIYENYPCQNFNYNAMTGWYPIFDQQFHSRTTSIYDAYAWFYYYQLIQGANKIIGTIDKAEGSEAEKNYIKAAALTFRAYSYEKLVHYYCYRWQDSDNGKSQGLVLRLDDSTSSLPYSTLAETYAQIYKDCEDAITLFSGEGVKDMRGTDIWIPNVNVAHAVYARAALTKQDYATALAQAKLARVGYDLMSNADYKKGFCDPTSEWIFGCYGSSDENNWYWSFGTMFACNGYYASNTEYVASIGHELISRIPNNDVRKGLFLTTDKLGIEVDTKDENQVDQSYGVYGGLDDNGIINEDIYNAAAAATKNLQAQGFSNSAYQSEYYCLDAQFKFWVKDMPGVGYLPLIRSSEMLLIEAEANYFLGNTSDAQANLVELNATSGRNPEYTCSKTGEDLFAEIRDYRSLELWGEGSEWSDYKRWNLPVNRKQFSEGGNTALLMAVEIKPEDGNKWTWEVPKNETDYNDKLALSTAK